MTAQPKVKAGKAAAKAGAKGTAGKTVLDALDVLQAELAFRAELAGKAKPAGEPKTAKAPKAPKAGKGAATPLPTGEDKPKATKAEIMAHARESRKAKRAGKPRPILGSPKNTPESQNKDGDDADGLEGSGDALTPLNERMQRFVEEYLIDFNATQAYLRAGYVASVRTASVNGTRLLSHASVAAAIAKGKEKLAARSAVKADWVIGELKAIAMADTRDLVSYHRGCCRYCFGAGGRYQRTAGELERDREAHEAREDLRMETRKNYEPKEFDEKGGDGYDGRKPPNPECVECLGEGIGRVVVKDTREISGAAATAYAGVKEGKDGVEVKLADKISALDKLARHTGAYEADNKQKAAAFTSPEALQSMSDAMEAARAKQLALMAERREAGFSGD